MISYLIAKYTSIHNECGQEMGERTPFYQLFIPLVVQKVSDRLPATRKDI